MRNRFVYIAVVVAIMSSAGTALAQIYSYETISGPGPDGFFGLGATVTQDTIGATHGTRSMKYDVAAGGFVGARTETVVPAALNDPPGVAAVLFDMTINTPYAGTFADIGVTVFGHALNAPGGAQFGHQVQFADTEPIAGKAAGTYRNLRIDLNQSQGPYRAGETFNQIFGPGPTDLTQASAFQFYISKNVANPVTVWIDNVRLVVPEPATCTLLGVAAVVCGAFGRRRRKA
jgi:hypothetical protein